MHADAALVAGCLAFVAAHGGKDPDAGRDLDDARDRPYTHLGVRADRVRVSDMVADFEFPDPGADRFDDASTFHAERQRQRHRVEPGAMVSIDEIEPGRGGAHPNFAGRGLSNLDFFPAHDFGTAGFVHANCVWHCRSPFSNCGEGELP